MLSRGGCPARDSAERKPRPSSAVRGDHGNHSRPSSVGEADSNSGPSRASSPCRNFVSENRSRAAKARPPSAPPQRKQQQMSKDESNIPVYLQRVKQAIASEEQFIMQKLRLLKGDDVPPGHRLLPTAERLEIQSALQSKKAELNSQFAKLPLRIQTLGQRQRASELEKSLHEVEEAIKQMSRDRVVVRM